jgi:G2/mitotic-specific cyclin-B, other
MTEILDRKPPKPSLGTKKIVPVKHYLSTEIVDSDIDCEYSRDILSNYYSNELYISSEFLSNQAEINYKHRAILVDWIHSTHRRFKLENETLFLAVSILDRYIAVKSVRLYQLQLLGLTVLFIAAKYEEIYAPELNELLKSIDSVFLKEQVVSLERDILGSLGFYISAPTSLKFFKRFKEIMKIDKNLESFAQYLLELSFDHRLVTYKPSVIAASSVIITHILFHKELVCKAKDKLAIDLETKNCIDQILAVLEFSRENPLKSVWDKFSKRRYHCVSSLTLL